jgi:hypothetical protein
MEGTTHVTKSSIFRRAHIMKFALAYADQAERDHAALKAAVRKGEIAAQKDA